METSQPRSADLSESPPATPEHPASVSAAATVQHLNDPIQNIFYITCTVFMVIAVAFLTIKIFS